MSGVLTFFLTTEQQARGDELRYTLAQDHLDPDKLDGYIRAGTQLEPVSSSWSYYRRITYFVDFLNAESPWKDVPEIQHFCKVFNRMFFGCSSSYFEEENDGIFAVSGHQSVVLPSSAKRLLEEHVPFFTGDDLRAAYAAYRVIICDESQEEYFDEEGTYILDLFFPGGIDDIWVYFSTYIELLRESVERDLVILINF